MSSLTPFISQLLQQLERREWKVFKKEIRRRKGMRKCGRNFLRYCDVDDNRKITLDEWIDCMGLNAQGISQC